MKNKNIQEILNTPMDRKQFVKYAGYSLMGVVGVGSAIKTLLKIQANRSQGSVYGYGGGPYGGQKSL